MAVETPTQTGVDLAAYCKRIGYTGALLPNLATLRALHEAHVGSIPFENIDVLLERPILLDTASLQKKLVTSRRGGYCFEQNCFFKDVLEAVGFKVTPLAARVRLGTTGIRPRTHMTLLVRAGGRDYLADTGFGMHGLLEPIPFESGRVTELPLISYRLAQEGSFWVLRATIDRQWSDLYVFTLEPQERIDYVVASHFVATHPESIFRNMLTAQIVRRHERKMLRQGELKIIRADREQTSPVRDATAAVQVLKEHFGIQLPQGGVLPGRVFAV